MHFLNFKFRQMMDRKMDGRWIGRYIDTFKNICVKHWIARNVYGLRPLLEPMLSVQEKHKYLLYSYPKVPFKSMESQLLWELMRNYKTVSFPSKRNGTEIKITKTKTKTKTKRTLGSHTGSLLSCFEPTRLILQL